MGVLAVLHISFCMELYMGNLYGALNEKLRVLQISKHLKYRFPKNSKNACAADGKGTYEVREEQQ